MKRLALSLLGGFLLPFLYSIVVAPLTPYIKNNTLAFSAMVPVRWPILLLYWLHTFPFGSEFAVLLYIVSCNVIFYGSMIYFVLFALSKRKETRRLPPGPDHAGTNTQFQISAIASSQLSREQVEQRLREKVKHKS